MTTLAAGKVVEGLCAARPPGAQAVASISLTHTDVGSDRSLMRIRTPRDEGSLLYQAIPRKVPRSALRVGLVVATRRAIPGRPHRRYAAPGPLPRWRF